MARVGALLAEPGEQRAGHEVERGAGFDPGQDEARHGHACELPSILPRHARPTPGSRGRALELRASARRAAFLPQARDDAISPNPSAAAVDIRIRDERAGLEAPPTSSGKLLREIMTARIIFGVALFVAGIVFRLANQSFISLPLLVVVVLFVLANVPFLYLSRRGHEQQVSVAMVVVRHGADHRRRHLHGRRAELGGDPLSLADRLGQPAAATLGRLCHGRRLERPLHRHLGAAGRRRRALRQRLDHQAAAHARQLVGPDGRHPGDRIPADRPAHRLHRPGADQDQRAASRREAARRRPARPHEGRQRTAALDRGDEPGVHAPPRRRGPHARRAQQAVQPDAYRQRLCVRPQRQHRRRPRSRPVRGA